MRSTAQKREIGQGMQFGVHIDLKRTRRADTKTASAVPEKPTTVRRGVGVRCSNRAPRLYRPTNRSRCARDLARESSLFYASAVDLHRAARGHPITTPAAACRLPACLRARQTSGAVRAPAAKQPPAD